MENNRDSIRSGIAVGTAISVGAITLLILLASTARTSQGLWTFESPAFGALLLIGVVQLLWMLPTTVILLAARRTRTLKGVLIVAAVLLVMNVVLFIGPVLLESGRSGRIRL